jgi:hypothetical protein
VASKTIADIAGPTGVGALLSLGIFLFLDGRDRCLFPTVETFAKTATWGVVAAVPLLAITYVVGVLLITGMESCVRAAFGLSSQCDATDAARMLGAEKSAAAQLYLQLLQDRGVLSGSAFSLIILAAGASSEIRNVPELKSSIVILALGTMTLSGLAYYYAGLKAKQAHQIADQIALALPPNNASTSR